MTTESTARSIERAASLRGMCDGAVHLPGDPGYDRARLPWNVAVDLRPAAVAFPATVDDVNAVVREAAADGLRVAAQGTGHNPGPLTSMDGTVLIRTSRMAAVTIDPVARVARVQAGALWLDVVEAAAEHGLAALHGSSPDVGVVGYSLGGGTGWYARKHGLAASSVTALDVVLADGSQARADALTNPELFWALRGGGGNFGVVTSMEFRLFPIETAYAGMLVWDQRDAGQVLRTWAHWCLDAPDEVTTSFRMLNLPPLPELPEAFRGRQLTVIDGAVLGTDEEGTSILAELRALGPQMDTFGRVPAASLSRLHMDPEGPTPSTSGTVMLDDLPEPAIASFLALTGPSSGSSLLSAELRQLGGTLGRAHDAGGALSRLDGSFLFFGVGIAATPEMGERAHADAAAVADALAPYATGADYLNFVESPVDVRRSFGSEVWQRLQTVRSTVDPTGTFQANHRVPRLQENAKPTPQDGTGFGSGPRDHRA